MPDGDTFDRLRAESLAARACGAAFGSLPAETLDRAADEIVSLRADRDRLRAALEAAVGWCPGCGGTGRALIPVHIAANDGFDWDCRACRPARDALAATKGEG